MKEKIKCILDITRDVRKAIYEYVAIVISLVFLVWTRLNTGEDIQNVVAISFAFVGLFIANKFKPGTTIICILIVVFCGKTMNLLQGDIRLIVFNLAVFTIGTIAIFMEMKRKNIFYVERVIAVATGLVNVFTIQILGVTPITIVSILLICFSKLFAMAKRNDILLENQREMLRILQLEGKKTNSELLYVLDNYPEEPKIEDIKTIEEVNYALALNLRKRVILIILRARKA